MNNIMPPATAPKFVKCGNVKVPIYHSKCGGKALYQVPYYPSDIGRRRLRSFRKPQDAQVFAKALAAGKAGDRHIVLRADPKLIRAATVLTAKFLPILDGYGITLNKAISEYQRAKELLKDKDLVKFVEETLQLPWLELKHTPFLTALDRFVEAKRAMNCRASTLERLQFPLRKVGNALKNPPLSQITSAQLAAVIYDPARSATTNHTYFSNLRAFYAWLCDSEYLPPFRKTSLDALGAPRKDKTTPNVIGHATARETLKFLALNDSPDRTLYFALSLFSGFRAGELMQSPFSDFDLQADTIRIPANISKTRTLRRPPLLPVAKAWLLPFAGRAGLVARGGNVVDRLSVLLRQHGIPWQHNWLRHSYSSYRFAQVGKLDEVTAETGNGPVIFLRHYTKLVNAKEAELYFQLTPEACGITDWPQRVAAFLKETPEVLVRTTCKRKAKPVPEEDDEVGAEE